MRSNIILKNFRLISGVSFALVVLFSFLFVSAQTVTLLHAEIHVFHEHEEYCETFDNLEKQSLTVDTSSTLIEAIPFVSICPVIAPCGFVQASISAYDSRAPPV